MAGVKGRSGGPRPGSGRKPSPPPAAGSAVKAAAGEKPLEWLLAMMNDESADPRLRLRAAIAAAQYVHKKTHDGGTKEARDQAAEVAGTGKFAPAGPPRLVASNG